MSKSTKHNEPMNRHAKTAALHCDVIPRTCTPSEMQTQGQSFRCLGLVRNEAFEDTEWEIVTFWPAGHPQYACGWTLTHCDHLSFVEDLPCEVLAWTTLPDVGATMELLGLNARNPRVNANGKPA